MTSLRLPLKDVTDFILDGTHGSPVRSDSGIPVLSAQNVQKGRIDFSTSRYTTMSEYDAFKKRLHLQPGDVALTIVGTIGRTAVVDRTCPAVFQRSVAFLRPAHPRIDSRYLYRCLSSADAARQLARATNTSSQAGVYLSRLKEIEIPVPSLDVQRRIAAILDKADELRAKRREALAHLDALTQSIFRAMFDPDEVFDEQMLESVVAPGTVITYGIVQAGDEYPGGVPYIRTGDLRDGTIEPSTLRHTDPEIAARFIRSRVQPGDIVMSIRATVGTVALVPACLEGANLTQGTARIAPGPSVDSNYLIEFLRSPASQRWIARQIKGATFKEITLERLRTLPVQVPRHDVQLLFAARVAAVERLKDHHRTQLAEFDALFASLQQRAFKGEL